MDSSFRLLDLYFKFQNGAVFTTKDLATMYDVSSRTMLRDIQKINEYLDTSKIINNRQTKTWQIDNQVDLYITKDEQYHLNIIQNLCKNEGDEFYKQSKYLFDKFTSSLQNNIFTKIPVQSIQSFKDLLPQIEQSIVNKMSINFIYEKRTRDVYPVKIVNLNAIWYLMAFDPKQDKLRRFHISRLENIVFTQDTFTLDLNNLQIRLDSAINANFDIDTKPYEIELFISSKIANIIKMRPISKTQRIIKNYSDNSYDISILITNDNEIIPTIKKFMPHIRVINNQRIDKKIKKDFEEYLKVI